MRTGKWLSRLLNSVIVLALALVELSGAASAQTAPAEVSTSTPLTAQISAGGTHACALTPEGGVVCWGMNSNGQLGNGTTDDSFVPVPVKGLRSGVISLATAWGRTCALTGSGRVYCWGSYAGEGGGNSSIPVEVKGLGNQVVQVKTGPGHSCALTSTGKVLCWGYNMEGELGNGTYTDSLTPVVAIASNAAQITTMYMTSCALMANSEVQCWGSGYFGQLGDGQTAPDGGEHKSNVPVKVLTGAGTPLTGARQVELGEVHGCALVGSGVYCWGKNRYGQMGIGVKYAGSQVYAAPVKADASGTPLSGADQLSVGGWFACVHLAAGGLKCWGDNQMGQIGNGTTGGESLYPATVLDPAGTASFTGVIGVTTGSYHACIFTTWESEHPYYCWGFNAHGELGAGLPSANFPLPQPVADISGLAVGGDLVTAQIISGGAHTCSFTAADGLKCWGDNTHGQLGNGTTTGSQVPVDVAGLSSDVKSVVLGQNFTCAILPWGKVKCWGENTHGQLGNGNKTDSPQPVAAALTNVTVTQLAAGNGHACALTSTGSVLCWGDNASGQLGDGSTTESTAPVTAIASGAVWVTAGGSSSCAVLDTGGVKCWGAGESGQLGDGNSDPGHHQTLATDVQVTGGGLLASVKQVALGADFGCALLESGQVNCWGKNDIGQLGRGTTSVPSAFASAVTAGSGGTALDGVRQVTAGGAHACARLYTNRLKCWGQGQSGQLGDGSSGSGAYTASPHPVLDHYQPYVTTPLYLEGVIQVSAGSTHTCAFLNWSDPLPYRCWGGNSSGQLGDGAVTGDVQVVPLSTTDKPYPNPVQNLLAFTSPPLNKIAAGYSFTCALTNAGGVKCWGQGGAGQLGNNLNSSSDKPVNVVGLASGVIDLASGNTHTCALTSTAGVKCWGGNGNGQLGDGSHNNMKSTPVDVSGLSAGVVEVVAGYSHSCALLSDSGVKCWGKNDNGQLGNGANSDSDTPVNVTGLDGKVIGLAAGDYHTCALTSTGGVKCWGLNNLGQSGNGTFTASYNTPVDVSGLSSGVVKLAAGDYHTCALTSSGGMKCWGSNGNGQLGSGTGTSNVPVDVVGLGSDVIGLSLGEANTCALITGGGVKCWGLNHLGQLGDGTNNSSTLPVDVKGLPGSAISLVSGAAHTCVVLAGLSPLSCWGWNSWGQFGNGTTTDSNVPVSSRWLTADGLIEDQKTQVIIPTIPNTALVVPAQPVEQPVVITATEVTTPPPAEPGVVPIEDATLDIQLDEKGEVHSWFYYNIPQTPSADAGLRSTIDESKLNLYYYSNGAWTPVLPCTGCSLDTVNHRLIASIDQSGIYAVMMSTSSDIYLPLVRK